MFDRSAYRKALIDWFDIESWANPIAVTLTMKKAIRSNGVWIQATPEISSQNLRHGLNLINKKAFKSASRTRRLKTIAICEQDESGRYHYHLAMDRPEHITEFRMRFLIPAQWSKTRWGHTHVDVQFQADNGWVGYITKLRSKPEYDEAIDLANCNLTGLS